MDYTHSIWCARGFLPIFVGVFDLYFVTIKSPARLYTARVGWTRSGSCGAGALRFGCRQCRFQ
jgi:hypothetical protein